VSDGKIRVGSAARGREGANSRDQFVYESSLLISKRTAQLKAHAFQLGCVHEQMMVSVIHRGVEIEK
jgi:hypothetical protein